jgi:hypothetical protein
MLGIIAKGKGSQTSAFCPSKAIAVVNVASSNRGDRVSRTTEARAGDLRTKGGESLELTHRTHVYPSLAEKSRPLFQ